MKQFDLTKIPPAALAKMEEKAANKAEPVDNTELVKDFRAKGGQILHIRPRRVSNGYTRGMTIAFVERSGRVEVATAIAHRVDCYSKKLGCKTAIEHFNAGKTITFPLRRDKKTTEAMKTALTVLCS